ncbi:MAG: UbiX family flavin prenyltransferase [Microbacteriaceae bacterium]
MKKKIIVGISGASGAIFGIRILELARLAGVETHLIISRGSRSTIQSETGFTVAEVQAKADIVYAENDLGAAPSSGSFRIDGMIVAPCSIKTLSAIANSYSDNLIARSADVTLKEQRKLVLMVRETPLHVGHLKLMLEAAQSGAIIYPPVPSFYTNPEDLSDVVDHTCRRALEQLGVYFEDTHRWSGMEKPGQAASETKPRARL